MKKSTIIYCGIAFSFIIVTFFLLAIVTPARNVKAERSDFYGEVYFGVYGQPPDGGWTLYTKVTKGVNSSGWHYQMYNDYYYEYAIFGTGKYRIEAEHRDPETQEVKGTGWIEVEFTGDPVYQYIITLPEKEPEK